MQLKEFFITLLPGHLKGSEWNFVYYSLIKENFLKLISPEVSGLKTFGLYQDGKSWGVTTLEEINRLNNPGSNILYFLEEVGYDKFYFEIDKNTRYYYLAMDFSLLSIVPSQGNALGRIYGRTFKQVSGPGDTHAGWARLPLKLISEGNEKLKTQAWLNPLIAKVSVKGDHLMEPLSITKDSIQLIIKELKTPELYEIPIEVRVNKEKEIIENIAALDRAQLGVIEKDNSKSLLEGEKKMKEFYEKDDPKPEDRYVPIYFLDPIFPVEVDGKIFMYEELGKIRLDFKTAIIDKLLFGGRDNRLARWSPFLTLDELKGYFYIDGFGNGSPSIHWFSKRKISENEKAVVKFMCTVWEGGYLQEPPDYKELRPPRRAFQFKRIKSGRRLEVSGPIYRRLNDRPERLIEYFLNKLKRNGRSDTSSEGFDPMLKIFDFIFQTIKGFLKDRPTRMAKNPFNESLQGSVLIDRENESGYYEARTVEEYRRDRFTGRTDSDVIKKVLFNPKIFIEKIGRDCIMPSSPILASIPPLNEESEKSLTNDSRDSYNKYFNSMCIAVPGSLDNKEYLIFYYLFFKMNSKNELRLDYAGGWWMKWFQAIFDHDANTKLQFILPPADFYLGKGILGRNKIGRSYIEKDIGKNFSL